MASAGRLSVDTARDPSISVLRTSTQDDRGSAFASVFVAFVKVGARAAEKLSAGV